jgi:hypothetical protein
MTNPNPQLPQARTDRLLWTDMPDGLLVYDLKRYRGHFLNQAATLIWRHCDGRTDVAALSALLRRAELPADEAVVWLALDRLAKAHLLQRELARPAAGISRRAVMRKLGLAGGLTVLLPVVASIAAPTPAMASSQVTKEKHGNNGLGNGLDGPPNGNAGLNDAQGSQPGQPGQQGAGSSNSHNPNDPNNPSDPSAGNHGHSNNQSNTGGSTSGNSNSGGKKGGK